VKDLIDVTFELGEIVLKMYRGLHASKGESAQLIRTLGGADQERIILQKIGKYWNQESRLDRPDGLVVITNHRLVFLTKLKTIVTTTDFLSFPLELIEGLEATRVMLISPAIRFRLQGREYTFTFLSNAAEVVSAVQSSKQAASLAGN
jgi:hypothetical protein